MDGSVRERDRAATVPLRAGLQTVLLHGCRFKAHRRATDVYDILTEGAGGMHVATAHSDLPAINAENAACLAASPEMLTALVDLVTAHARGDDLPWGRVQSAILAGFGAPEIGDYFINRGVELIGECAVPASSIWRVSGLGFCPQRRVMVRLAGVSNESVGVECSFDDLCLRFQAEEA